MQLSRSLDLVRPGQFNFVQKRACRPAMTLGQMQVDGCGLEIGMAKQCLYRRQIGALFQQMRSGDLGALRSRIGAWVQLHGVRREEMAGILKAEVLTTVNEAARETEGSFRESTVPVTPRTIRTQILRALHAEGAKRGLKHEEIREIAQERFGIGSMGELDVDQVQSLYRHVVGREFRSKHPGIRDANRRQAAGTAGRHRGQGGNAKIIHLVCPEDMELLHQLACGRLGWVERALKGFIRRQLRGHEQMRTMADLNAVLWPVKRMVREREKRK